MNVSQPVTIRAAAPEDAELVGTLVGEMAAYQDQAGQVTAEVAQWREMLALPEVTVLLAEVDDRVVGYASAVRRLHLWTGAEVIWLDDLYVRHGHRDQGLGLGLMHALAERADGLTITWGVQPDNLDAIRFYERLGATIRHKVLCAWPPTQHPPQKNERREP